MNGIKHNEMESVSIRECLMEGNEIECVQSENDYSGVGDNVRDMK